MQVYSKIFRVIFLFLLPCHFAFAAIFTTVPFSNIPLAPGDFVFAGYVFGDFPAIYCFDNTFQVDPPVASMSWTFQGQVLSATLSQTTLINNINFQGIFADPVGTISIQNISASPLAVNCQFAF